MYKYIALAILLMAQNTWTMEKAIVDGNFDYVRKNIKNLTEDSKEIYLEIAKKQVDLATSKSDSAKPNLWDAASFAASTALGYSAISGLKNFLYLWEERKDCISCIGKLCEQSALKYLKSTNEINEDIFDAASVPTDKEEYYKTFYDLALRYFVSNPQYFYSLETKAGTLRRSLLELPDLKIYNHFITTSVKLILASWLIQRAYGSHYKNLDLKNRLAIKQLIENAQISEVDEKPIITVPEKTTLNSLKEKFSIALSEAKSTYSELKNKSNELITKTKLKLESMDKQQKIKAAIGTVAGLTATALLVNKFGNKKTTKKKYQFTPGLIGWNDKPY